ncbi:G-type lectin S-receptor-like serine/threonine-protein kinase At2g19130 [Cryptomeria japonica]|uniref:G-type lectin S-receptor-like serine/threonine-protein kinase At2g19130 n=1 Tax=Cryptomeria japonica TaxID=3369 RepID=UPI0027D9F6A6|nr:G-type lectin S-receptor-like serine/threonine-protein kinase At2g19130 [Cryptomeria japonica]
MAARTDSSSRASRRLMLIPLTHTLQPQRMIARKPASSIARALHLLSNRLPGRAKSGQEIGFDNKSETLWQSFDYPVDTMLPGMRFGGQQKLISWKSSLDPAPGLFSFHGDPSGVKQFVLTWNNSVQYWASGALDGKIFSGVPEMTDIRFYNITVENTKSGWYVTDTSMPILSRFVLAKSGGLQLYGLLDNSRIWNFFWSQPRDQCAVYGLCGAYGICDSNNIQFCSCVEGFTPTDIQAWDSREWWFSGCARQSPLNCDAKNGSTDGFLEPSVTSPDVDSAYTYPATTKNDCQKVCLLNCSCTAFTFKPPSGPCQMALAIQGKICTAWIAVLPRGSVIPFNSKAEGTLFEAAELHGRERGLHDAAGSGKHRRHGPKKHGYPGGANFPLDSQCRAKSGQEIC